MARIVLGVGGGIAAYKAVYLLRVLTAKGHFVTPILTDSATRFVGPTTFSALASEAAKVSLFEDSDSIPHTHLGRSADLICIAPATADLIFKLANGAADDLLTATVMASKAQVVLAPAMHEEMWENFAVQRNIKTLSDAGYFIVPPSSGSLAAGDIGMGRMAEPDVISDFVSCALAEGKKSLLGRKVLVSAGGTQEPIDPVRYIGNRSSGKQGRAFAKVAACFGAEVVLVTSTPAPEFPGVKRVFVGSAEEMSKSMHLEREGADIVIMAAAVSDFRVANVSTSKIKREGRERMTLELVANGDILTSLTSSKSGECIYVGFAAETDSLEENLEKKLRAKGVDIIVGNDVTRPGAGFDSDTNSVTVLTKSGDRLSLELVSKEMVAVKVLAMAHRMLEGF